MFVPKREEVAEGWRRLHAEELHDLYASLCIWCGYEVPLCNLEPLQPDHSKDMSLHVLTGTSCNFNTLTPVVWKL